MMRQPRASPERDQPIAELADVAIDFVDMTPIADRMRVGFFASSRHKAEGTNQK